jgi:hypothetical protein
MAMTPGVLSITGVTETSISTSWTPATGGTDPVTSVLQKRRYVTPPGATSDTITQYGITWTFDREYPVGQYVTGDWWVVGPVTITDISPLPVADTTTSWSGEDEGQGTGRNGSVLNPRFTDVFGYDSRIRSPSSRYSGLLCKVPPFALSPGDSLVSTTSYASKTSYTWVENAAVLTCVDSRQSETKFRPPYCRATRVSASASDTLLFDSSAINWSLLPKLSRTPVSNIPTLSTSIAKVSRPQIDCYSSYIGGDCAPKANQQPYGREMADDIAEVALQLTLDYTNEQLSPALIGMIQIGIDHWGTVQDGGYWVADGVIWPGRKFPILFAGKMLGETFNPSLKIGSGLYRFHEDGQTYYYDDDSLPATTNASFGSPGAYTCKGQKGWIGIAGGGAGGIALWRAKDNTSYGYVLHEHMDVANWADNTTDYHDKQEQYRRDGSIRFIGMGLSGIIMGLKSTWNHDAFFDYCDRWMTEDDSDAYTAYFARYGINQWTTPFRQGTSSSLFTNSMWANYRGSY